MSKNKAVKKSVSVKKQAEKKSDKSNISLEILTAKGETLHSFPNMTKEQAKQLRRSFYRVLIQKLKQNVSFKMKAS